MRLGLQAIKVCGSPFDNRVDRGRQLAYAMRPLKVWHRVGPPTWKRSGTLVFTAVMGVLLIGGTAMAVNLGLLTSTAPRDRGYRLDVPRPALSVSLPPTSSTSSTVDSTSTSTSASEGGDDEDHDTADADHDSPAAEHSSEDHSEAPGHDSDDVSSGDGREADDDDDDDIDTDDDSRSSEDVNDPDQRRARSDESDTDHGPRGPGRNGALDDD